MVKLIRAASSESLNSTSNPRKNSEESLVQSLRTGENKKAAGKCGAAAACCSEPCSFSAPEIPCRILQTPTGDWRAIQDDSTRI